MTGLGTNHRPLSRKRVERAQLVSECKGGVPVTHSDNITCSEMPLNLEEIRVVFVSQFPVDIDQPRGGVATATVGLVRALLNIGVVDLHVVSLEYNLDKLKRERHDGIEVHRLPRSGWPMMFDVFNGPSAKRLHHYVTELNPSVVHFHETWGFGASRWDYPNVFTVHGFDSLNLPTEKPSGWWLRAKLWRLLERKALSKQRMLISIAPYVRREFESLSLAPIVDIWNTLGRQFFSLERKERPHNILFLGWLNRRKNPLVLVEAAAQLIHNYPELHIMLCGEPSDLDYVAELEARIAALGLSEVVSMLGHQSQPEVMQRLQTAGMLVLPSLQENAPMVVAEAMAVGVPVVASNLCGIPDMIEDYVTGLLIDPHDVSSLVKAVSYLLDNDDRRLAMGEAARAVAIKRFHPDSVAQATIQAYAHVMMTNGSQQ